MIISYIRKHLTWLIYTIIVLFGLSVFVMGFSPLLSQMGVGQKMKPITRSVAESRGHNFSYMEMEEVAQMRESQASQQGLPTNPINHVAFQSQAIDILSERGMLMDIYNEKDLSIDPAEKEKIIDQFCTSVLGAVGNQQKFDDTFLGNKSKRNACKQGLSQLRNDITFDAWVQDVEEQLKIQAVVKHVGEAEANSEKKKTRERLERVLKSIKGKGEEGFKAEAIKLSEDTSNKDKGGDLGEFGRGVMVKPFEEAVFKAKVGDIVGPVETQFGYHLIYVYGKKEAKGPEFEAESDAIRERLLKEKLENNEALTGSKKLKTKDIKVSTKEVKEAFEKVSARHILLKVKSQDDLFSAWMGREKSKLQVVIRDPLVEAFRYENRMPPFGGGTADPDETVRLYKAAVAEQDFEAVRYYYLSKALQARYEAAVNKAEKDAADKTAELEKKARGASPTVTGSMALSPSVEPVKAKSVPMKDLEEALDVINTGIRYTEIEPEIGSGGQPSYPSQIKVGRYFLQRAELKEKLKPKDKTILKDVALAVENAAGDVQTLYGAKALYEKFGKKKEAAEVETQVARLMEAFRAAQEAANPQQGGGQAPAQAPPPSDRGEY